MYNTRVGGANLTQESGVMKLKVGGGAKSPASDAQLVNEITRSANSSKTPWLRLDANQSWTAQEYQSFINGLTTQSKLAIEYIEEPVIPDSTDIPLNGLCGFHESPCIPLAVDESTLNENVFDHLESCTELRIINKTFLHGIRDANKSLRDPNRTTITCTFETGVGLIFLVAYAAVVNPSAYHGIHALPGMISADAITERFANAVERDSFGQFISIETIEKLMHDFLVS
jgi:L-alanine-DL-glutamate epimerase-like enolase superfamily enzyme